MDETDVVLPSKCEESVTSCRWSQVSKDVTGTFYRYSANLCVHFSAEGYAITVVIKKALIMVTNG